MKKVKKALEEMKLIFAGLFFITVIASIPYTLMRSAEIQAAQSRENCEQYYAKSKEALKKAEQPNLGSNVIAAAPFFSKSAAYGIRYLTCREHNNH